MPCRGAGDTQAGVILDTAMLEPLADGGAIVVDDVLPEPILDSWLARAAASHQGGGLAPAGIGASRALAPELRSDHTAFVEPGDHRWADTIGWFADLGSELSERLRVSLPAFSLQVAGFPPGARYVRHLDTIRGDASRRLTAILYLDRSWRAEDRGALRLVEPSGERDVLPIGGRLVLFRSDSVPHEVLPVRRARYALTTWFGSEGAIDARRSPDGSPSRAEPIRLRQGTR